MDKITLHYFRKELEKKAMLAPTNVGNAFFGLTSSLSKGIGAVTKSKPNVFTLKSGRSINIPYSSTTRIPLKKPGQFADPADYKRYTEALRTPATKAQMWGQKMQGYSDSLGLAASKHNNLLTKATNVFSDVAM